MELRGRVIQLPHSGYTTDNFKKINNIFNKQLFNTFCKPLIEGRINKVYNSTN